MGTITDSKLKQLIPIGLEELIIKKNGFVLKKNLCEQLIKFNNLRKLHIHSVDFLSFQTFLETNGQQLTKLTIDYVTDAAHILVLQGLVREHCLNISKCSIMGQDIDY